MAIKTERETDRERESSISSAPFTTLLRAPVKIKSEGINAPVLLAVFYFIIVLQLQEC